MTAVQNPTNGQIDYTGWWQASDGNWYPPTQSPGYVHPAPAVTATRTSGLAIASMVLGILFLYGVGAILAIIFGHVAMSQMKSDPQLGGRRMAKAGLILGYCWLGLLVAVFVIAAAVSAGSTGS
jgi:hypothetical protein